MLLQSHKATTIWVDWSDFITYIYKLAGIVKRRKLKE